MRVITQKLNGNSQKMCSIQPLNKTLSTMLEGKVGNRYIQSTQPIKQKKRNRIKMPTPVEVRTS